jgi:hypothetical protein
MNTSLSTPAARSHAVPAAGAARMDLYTGIHKALRRYMADTLSELGRVNVDDDHDCHQVAARVQGLLQQLRAHLQHENDFVHTAIEARRPGATRRPSEDHQMHIDAIANLEDETRAMVASNPAQRAVQALRLYRHLAVFVAHNLEHMQLEETENNAALWALYSDAELAALHGQLLASLSADEMARTLHWMALSLTPQELTALFSDMRASAPPAAFEAMFDVALAALDTPRAAHLARSLGLPPVPGLINV